ENASKNVIVNQLLWAVLNLLALVLILNENHSNTLFGPPAAIVFLYFTFLFWEQTWVMNNQLAHQILPAQYANNTEMMKLHIQLLNCFWQLASAVSVLIAPMLWTWSGFLGLTIISFFLEVFASLGYYVLRQRLQNRSKTSIVR
ncbi:hypothetical protein RFI_30806, partial [Reticulomyxa filosa]